MNLVVHILLHGFPLCQFTAAVPREWPRDHKWVGVDDVADATCPGCLKAVEDARQRKGV
jgi:hypothetical protein